MYETTETERVEGASQHGTPTDDAIGRRGFLTAAGLVGAGVTAGPVAGRTGPDDETSDAPTVTVSPAETSVDPGETTTVDIGLTEAPSGLSGFTLEISVDTDVATVVDAGLGESFTDAVMRDIQTADGTASLTAVKAISAGATDLDVCDVDLEGVADGETAVEVEIGRLEDIDGAIVESTVESATLTVGDGESVGGGSDSAASGPGADGADDTIPGFGPLVTMVGATGGVACALRRRLDRSDTGG
jgi:PGF-CTERM protein